jgi:hypothetical protein
MGNACAGMELEFEMPEIKVKKASKDKKQTKRAKKTRGAGIIEQPTYDETSLKGILPSGATLKDSLYSEYNLGLMKEARRRAVEYERWLNECEWEEFKDRDGVVVYTCPNKLDSEVLVRRDVSVHASLETCVKVLSDLVSLKAANDRIQFLDEVEKLGTGARILYQKMHGGVLMKSRDFTMCNSVISLKNGEKCIVNFPCEHDNYVAESSIIKGSIRSLFWIKRVSANQTEIVSLLNLDMGEKLPAKARSNLPEIQWEDMKNLKAIMERL